MSKHRIEAFSDGVFAIVITLLILTIRIPDVPPAALGEALSNMLPQVFTYVLSFFVVGLYWFAHHRVSHQVKLIDGPFIWLNLVWLLFVSVMPFPAALLGRYPLQGIPIAVYGIDLILANATGFLIIVYLKNHSELCVNPISSAALRGQAIVYGITNGIYVVAIGFARLLPWISYGIYAVVLAWLMIRHARISNPFLPKSP
ncbi:MAG: TMEM175 family protein [Spirochaetia bacterium]